MSDVDDKLKMILRSYDASPSDVPDDMFDKEVVEVKRAFADAGYVKVPKQVEDTWRVYNHTAGYMTHQEWYDRFAHALARLTPLHSNIPAGATVIHHWKEGDVLEAAKKAAGVE